MSHGPYAFYPLMFKHNMGCHHVKFEGGVKRIIEMEEHKGGVLMSQSDPSSSSSFSSSTNDSASHIGSSLCQVTDHWDGNAR